MDNRVLVVLKHHVYIQNIEQMDLDLIVVG